MKGPQPVYARNTEVTARAGEDPTRMIKRFIKKVRNEGILAELHDRRFYRKPSEKKRRKAAKARAQRASAEKIS